MDISEYSCKGTFVNQTSYSINEGSLEISSPVSTMRLKKIPMRTWIIGKPIGIYDFRMRCLKSKMNQQLEIMKTILII